MTTGMWCGIWRAMQELAAALHPLIESGNVPDWATRLGDALDEAEEPVANRALEESHG